jgi:hypothetical protein
MFCYDIVIVDYYNNTASYAINCINKARPKLQCNGKCQLMKKLKEIEKKEQENSERKVEYKYTKLITITSTKIATQPFSIITDLKSPNLADGEPTSCSIAIFHPPKA